MSSDKSGSPPCGIYIRIDDFSNMLDVIGWVRKLAFTINGASGYKKNMSIIELVYTVENVEKIKDLVPIIQQQGMISIISGPCEDVVVTGADGVLLDALDMIDDMRASLGDDAIIGVSCGAKEAAEIVVGTDVDFITLNADPSLITWWSAQSEILCVADGENITANACVALAAAGADFVQVSDYILTHEKDIMQGTVNVLDALKQADEMPKILN